MFKSSVQRLVSKDSILDIVERLPVLPNLFGNMVDEQLIQQYTGHRSTESVRQYKRASDDHFKLVSRILQPPPANVCAFCSQNDNGPSMSFKDDDDRENRSADDATKQNVAHQSHGAVGIASTPSTPHFRSPP